MSRTRNDGRTASATGWLTAVLVLVGSLAHPAAAQQTAPAEATQPATTPAAATGSVVGWLELSGPLRDGPVPFAWVTSAEAGPSLRDVVRQLDTVAEGTQYRGVVIYFDQPELSLTQVNTIAEAIERTRAAGKQVLTFAESYDMLSYALASSADLILLQHRGAVELTGLAVEEIYLAGLLEKVGAKADLLQVGQFKGAEEPLTRTGPSDAWSQNIGALLDDLYGQIVQRIADGRGMTPDEVEAVIRDSWTMSDSDYLQRRVVDRLTGRDLVDVTQLQFGDSFTWDDTLGLTQGPSRQADNPFALFSTLFEQPTPKTHRDSIAVVHATGPISSGDSAVGDGLFSADAIGSRTLVKVLGEVRDDPNIKGVILRIDSPGGSALASEVIWQAVRDLGEHKPVFASIGAMAASGGYYIACAADEIYVAPQSVVGSIGVVGGKIVLGDLYEKLGITVHRRSRGPLSDMFNSVEPFTTEQREVILASMQRVYEQFTDRVAIGRGNRLEDITQVAQGRLFTGRQAVSNGLVDQVGGLGAVQADLADQLGPAEGAYDVVHLPAPMSLGEFLGSIFSVRARSTDLRSHTLTQTAQQVLGPQGWTAASRVLSGLMLLRDEPTLTLMPYAIVFR